VTPWLVVVALVVGTGAVAALAAGEPRLGLVGLALALLGATLLSDPLPSPTILGVRLTAALLAVAILRAVSPAPARRRDDEDHDEVRWHLGWPAAAVVGAAGAAAGLAIAASMPAFVPVDGADLSQDAGVGGGALGATGIALGVGCGLLALAVPAAVTERLGPRRAAAVLLLVQSAILLRVGLAGAPSLLEEIVLGSLIIAVAAAAGLLVSAAMVGAEGGTHQP
jgi:hypothetical protein